MSQAFRTKVISTFTDEIALLTGGRFEQFGYRVMSVIYPASWQERGTTIEGAPRGYTVDASTKGSTIVAEMSSERDYFEGKLEKPERDLDHTIELHPDSKRIWLLSSREAGAGATTKCANLETNFTKKHPTLKAVDILDSRQIANHIFENLEVERFINSLTSYLPSIGRIADENAFSHRIPNYSGYQNRPELEDEITDKITKSTCCVISGISGVGKSALAAKVAENLRSEFEIVIWCDARVLRNVAELSDIDIRRSGTRHNLIGLIRRRKCLLILDDTSLTKDCISEISIGESKVLITCQISSDPNSTIVRNLQRTPARVLLQKDIVEVCPDEVFESVFSAIGGYPLLICALNRIAKDEGWRAVESCCEDATSSIEDEFNNKVCQRILMHHRLALSSELEFVKWCGSSRIDSELLSICVSSRAGSNLQKRAFLSATVSGNIRVHDIVYQSILATVEVSEQQSRQFCDKLDDFISTECESERSLLNRIVNFHSPLLKGLLKYSSRPSFVYAVALARTEDTSIDLLGDPVPAATTVATYGEWNGHEIEVRAIIEVVEALYTINLAQNGYESAKTMLQNNIIALEILLSSSAAKGEMARDLKHHFAKMLIRLGKKPEAEVEFVNILKDYPTYAASRLQLARILNSTGRKKDALAEAEMIIQQHLKNPGSVAAPILLEALRLVATLGSLNDIKPYRQLIISCLKESREFDKALTLRLISSVAQKTWYKIPELVSQMFESIEWSDAAPATDFERSDWAQAHKSIAKASDPSDSNRQEFLLAANETYKSIDVPNNYHRVQHAETLILLEEYAEANAILEQVAEDKRDTFWWQRRSQAFYGLNQPDQALEAINTCISELADRTYSPAFLYDRFKAKMKLDDPTAKNDLKEAINKLPEGDKFRNNLELELNNLP